MLGLFQRYECFEQAKQTRFKFNARDFCPVAFDHPLAEGFSRMRSEGSRFIWGSGGEAVFAESCVYVRNRPQPFAWAP